MEFVVDSPNPDATLKMTGRELKDAVGVKKHIHLLEEVDGLPREIREKSLTKLSERSRAI